MNNIEYGLEPLPHDSPLRRKRNAVKTKRKGKMYSVRYSMDTNRRTKHYRVPNHNM